MNDALLDALRDPWLLLGLIGQAIFSLRFVVQWIHSERAGRSIVPEVFWQLSIAGSALLLLYSLYRRDLVFIIGQSTGFLVYARNIALRRREVA